MLTRRQFMGFFGIGGLGLFVGNPGNATAHIPIQRRKPLLLQECKVAGLYYYHAADNWQHIQTGQSLQIIREADNIHDRRAVKVHWNGLQLGYIPRRENHVASQLLDRGQQLVGQIQSVVLDKAPMKMSIQIWAV